MNHLDAVSQVWNDSLFTPVEGFLSRPRKDFRGELVRIGFGLHQKSEMTVDQSIAISGVCEVLEWIHSGSLIVDDIQDDSIERRGAPTVHRLYGMPKALNAGNWMYFKALESIHHLPLSSDLQLRLLRCAHVVMAKAHQGQALDLGADLLKITKEEVPHIVEASHLMKSGALVALALQFGALIADANGDLGRLDHLGAELGASLQRFDDIGNVRFGGTDAKDLEDLRLRRPSWLWTVIAEDCDDLMWSEFKAAILMLPQESALQEFLERTSFKSKATLKALNLHSRLSNELKQYAAEPSQTRALEDLLKLMENIANAY
ncbi:polyprenyl synthetase family protein [Bdellovibrio sp. HCB290]|uniref:polyprenyl synthetase family protein n=1 Tax=Bdellovibrio sp. HCB290 TaxID=3394356 RepID=UPI0039B4BC96